MRAAKLSRVPGVTIAAACQRFDVTAYAVRRARKGVQLSPAELALAALTTNGTVRRGRLELTLIADWVDYVNHDGCNEADVRRLLDTWVTSGVLAIEDQRWRLLVAWP